MTMTALSPTLPYPASQSYKMLYSPSHPRSRSPLFQRSRATNLAVSLLCAIAALSIMVNLRQWMNSHAILTKPGTLSGRLPVDIKQTLNHPYAGLKHMVMVPGHAIWMGCDVSKAKEDQDWMLEPFQKGGDVRTFVKHIMKGAEIAVNDPEALLIYSGGQTRPNIELTEATSYARLAKLGDFYGQASPSTHSSATKALRFERVTTEEFALDSFENLLFGLARFKEFTGRYPTFLTVVGYGMKRQRYEELHRAALRWPLSAFKYIGIDNDHDMSADYEGERKGGLAPFLKDMYGCSGTLIAKRRRRNIYRRFHPYHSSAPELSALMQYCPRNNAIFPGRLPWD